MLYMALICLDGSCMALRMEHGAFTEHLPVILVAQEWRRWAMEVLQHNLSPKPEVKAGAQKLEGPKNKKKTDPKTMESIWMKAAELNCVILRLNFC